MRLRCIPLALSYLLAAALFPLSAQVAPDLFAEPSKLGGPAQVLMHAADDELPEHYRLVRSRLVRINLSAVDPDNEGRPRSLRLNFFPDSAFEATEFIARRRDSGEGFEWIGSTAGGMPAQAVLSVIDGRVSGSFGAPQAHFQIRHVEGDLHLIQEVLLDKQPADDAIAPDLPGPNASNYPLLAAKSEGPATVNAAGATVLDVLVCYTTLTRKSRGGSQTVRDRIHLAISEANASFINSAIPLEFRLAAAVEIDGPGPSGLTEAPSVAYIQDATFNRTDIHALRNYYGADLVSIWVNNSSGGVVGIAWVFQGHPAFSEYTYSIVSYAYALGPGYTFAHEAGHNMGAAHDRHNAGVGGRYSYSYGYRRKDSDPKFYSIMAYGSGCSGCAPVNHWSNPLVSIQRNGASAPSGVDALLPDSADNALTFSNTAPIQSAYRPTTNPPPNNPPQAGSQTLEMEAGGSLVIVLTAQDPDFDPLVFDITKLPSQGSLAGSGAAWTYSPAVGFLGTDSFSFHVHDGRGGFSNGTVSILVTAPPSGPGQGPDHTAGPRSNAPPAEVIEVAVSSQQWLSVPLSKTYVSPVVVCSPLYAMNAPSAIVRMRAVTPSSFELRAVRVDKGPLAINGMPVQCLAVEEGVYTPADHGVRLEAVRYQSVVTDSKISWTGEQRDYAGAYVNPVVVGQVMTANDANWSSFWARGDLVETAPSPTALFAGKHVGEDPNRDRVSETVGYIVLEAGLGGLGGFTYQAGVGPPTVRGRDNNPPFTYPLALADVSAGVVSSAGMTTADGGWPVLLTPTPFPAGSMRLMIDEDRLQDSERSHTLTRVAYVAFAEQTGDNQVPTANPQSVTTPYETALAITLTGTDPDQDPLTFAIVAPPSNGALTGTAPNVTYTPSSGFSGSDGFTFSVNDGRGGVDQAVVSISVGEAPNQPPTATPQSLSTPHQTPLAITLAGTDPGQDPLTFVIVTPPSNGALSGRAPTLTYTPNAGFSGPDGFTFSVSDGRGGVDQAVVSISVEAPVVLGALQAEVVEISIGSQAWSFVGFAKVYASPIVVCSPLYSVSAPSAIIRMRDVSSNGFEARVVRVDKGPLAVNGMEAQCLVVEEGVYTAASHGVKLEAARYQSSVTDSVVSWAGESRAYSNAYADPVVVGQVMTANDSQWSAFWARGESVDVAPSPAALHAGKHVGEDPSRDRVAETVGYIVIESGFGNLGGRAFQAGVGPMTVRGRTNSPPYSYPLALPGVTAGVVSSAGMTSSDGGWPVLLKPTPFPAGELHLMIDEDRLHDSERSHTFTRVAYVVFSDQSGANLPPTATPQSLAVAYETPLAITLTGTEILDPLTFAVTAQPGFGSLSGTAPSLTYTPHPLYSGPDSLSFSVSDSHGGVGEAVVSITVGEPASPPSADQQRLATGYQTPLSITISGAGAVGSILTYAVLTSPAHGSLTGVAPQLTYSPEPGFFGLDSFTFSASDGQGGMAEATVWISVTKAVNQQQFVISTAAELALALRNAAPGERYLLAPGLYARPSNLVFTTSDLGLLGTAEHPIVFEALDQQDPPTISTLLVLQSPQHVQFKNIRFVDPPGNVHDVNIYPMQGIIGTDLTFDGCYFHMRPELIGLASIKATRINNLYVRNSTFSGWGDNAIDTIGVWGGVIEDNVFVGEPTHRQRTALQLKGETRDLIVRNNYFENAGDRVIQVGGSTGLQFFRGPAEFEAVNIEMYGNRIVGGDACFSLSTQQGSRFHHNTCYLPARWIGRLLQENNDMLPNREGRVDFNMFVYTGGLNNEFVNQGGDVAFQTFVFDNNAYFQVDGDRQDFPRLPTPDVNVVRQVDPELIEPGTARMRIGSTNAMLNGIGADAVNPVP